MSWTRKQKSLHEKLRDQILKTRNTARRMAVSAYKTSLFSFLLNYFCIIFWFCLFSAEKTCKFYERCRKCSDEHLVQTSIKLAKYP